MIVTKEQVIEVLKKCNDPELQIDIWTLELVYDIQLEEDKIHIKMTFTSPMCPYGPMLVDEVKTKLEALGVKVEVEVVFDPPWKPSDDLRALLGV